MTASDLTRKLRRLWNWFRGKRIVLVNPVRGRVMVRTGHNSKIRSNGGQWYLLTYEVANGVPALPSCSRGNLDRPESILHVERCTGEEYGQARRWYQSRFGPLPAGHELDLACVFDPGDSTPASRLMRYRPTETFEVEHPWLSSQYCGRTFASYFGTWYGSGELQENDVMDFEAFWVVRPSPKPLPRWGASWR